MEEEFSFPMIKSFYFGSTRETTLELFLWKREEMLNLYLIDYLEELMP